MLLGIDHLVIVVKDLERAARDYEQLGFHVVPGGRHPVGSHNALIAFGDGSYLEIISFYREAADHRWWEPLKQGERLVDYCMQTDDLKGDTQRFRDGGVAINDPVPWSRTRPDGYELKWLLSLATGEQRGVAPFLIQDITPRAERIPQDFAHKNGARGIGKVTVAVNDLVAVGRWFDAVRGGLRSAVALENLQAKGFRYQAGAHAIEFVAPTQSQSPIGDWLRMYGSSPYSATILGGDCGAALDSALCHGANLIFASGAAQ